VEHVVAAVRTALQGLVRESPTLGAETRAAAAAKLEQVAINVLLPDEAAAPSRPAHRSTQSGSGGGDMSKGRGAGLMGALAAHWAARWRLEVQARLARNAALLALEHARPADNTSAVAVLRREHAELLREEYRHTMAHEVVNAWYDPTRNTITIPPGILGAPFYVAPAGRERGADALLPRIGAVVGHELGHALDVNGRFFDEWGRYVDRATGWWQAADERALSGRITCLAAEYAHPCGREDYGMHTMGEDMADQLGVRAALRAWRAAGQPAERDGAFFAAYAQLWCAHLSEQQRCARVEQDVHALPRHRVNKVLRQLAPFGDAYACPANASMVSSTPCIVY
jgi:predicted metalloendopeptidase